MRNRFFAYMLLIVMAVGLVISSVGIPALAQTTSGTQLQSAEQQKAALQAELAGLEKEIAEKEALLKLQQNHSGTLSGEIAALTTQINKKKLDIKAKNLVIQQLGGEITEKGKTIRSLEEKIAIEKESLAQLIRKTNEIDKHPLIHIVMSSTNLSDFYNDVAAYNSLKASVNDSVNEIKGVKQVTLTEKEQLEKKQSEEMDVKAALEDAQRTVEKDQANQKQLLSISKNKETEYKALVAERQKKAAEIRTRLFQFSSGAAVPAIQFADAVRYADVASKATGVRSALILAIVKQETDFGNNTGSCYLTNPVTGAGAGANTGSPFPNVMKPTRDVAPFLEIMQGLGRDPYKTRVSCPVGATFVNTTVGYINPFGYGGAMGYTQFIPSTWKLFQSRVAAAVGKAVPDPWVATDAFAATGLYLKDLGAGAQTYSAEIGAACRYYGTGGTTCAYGKSVMAIAQGLQDDIDYVNQYGVAK